VEILLVIGQDPAKAHMKRLVSESIVHKASSIRPSTHLIAHELVGIQSMIWNSCAHFGFGLVSATKGRAILEVEHGGDPV